MDSHDDDITSQQPLRDRTISQLCDYKVALQRLAVDDSSSFSYVYENVMDIVKDVLANLVPQCLFCLTSNDVEQYVVSLLCMPSTPASITFSCFVYVLTGKKNSSILLDLFQKFLKKKIVKLLEEITSFTSAQGPDKIIQEEHYQNVINSLLHLPDVISNVVKSSPPPFFIPSTYNNWLSDSLLDVYMGYLEDRNNELFAKLVSKTCVLGLTNALARSVAHFLQLLRKYRKPSRPEERLILLLKRPTLVNQLSQFIRMIPLARYRDFVNELFEEEMDHMSTDCTFISIVSQQQLSIVADCLMCGEFSMKSTVHLLVTLMNQNEKRFDVLFEHISKAFASSQFVFRYSTEQQKRIGSLVYCLLKCRSPEENSPIISTIMNAIGNRLSDVDETIKPVVVGIAKNVALIVSPEGHYNWPEDDLSELDSLITTPPPSPPPPSVENEEEPQESVFESGTSDAPSEVEETKYVNPEEDVDIFMEEIIFEPTEEEDEEDEDSFIPYDLTDIQDDSIKSYFYIAEALIDLSSDNHATLLHAWKEFHRLCCEESQKMSQEEVSRVMRAIIEMNGMVGNTSFWDEWREVLETLIYRNCEVSMQELYRFIRKNGRSNLSVNKCVVILQSVHQACVMLTRGSMQIQEETPVIPEKVDVQLSGEVLDSNDIRIANTKYRPSFYKRKLQDAGNASKKQTSNTADQSGNLFTENSRFVVQLVVSWILRFPPRDESVVSYHIITLSLLFSLPVLTSVFDGESRDICSLILRYRFHASIMVRRSVLQLYSSTTKYTKHSNFALAMLDKNKAIDWLSSVIDDDPDDACRTLAAGILRQLGICGICLHKHLIHTLWLPLLKFLPSKRSLLYTLFQIPCKTPQTHQWLYLLPLQVDSSQQRTLSNALQWHPQVPLSADLSSKSPL